MKKITTTDDKFKKFVKSEKIMTVEQAEKLFCCDIPYPHTVKVHVFGRVWLVRKSTGYKYMTEIEGKLFNSNDKNKLIKLLFNYTEAI